MSKKKDIIKIPTLVERLQKRGFKKVAEFNAEGSFPVEKVLGNKFGNRDYPISLDIKIVDKAKWNYNYMPRKVYEVYTR